MTRCKDFVERDGYWTGRKCNKTATWTVTYENSPEAVNVCGIHKNKRLRNHWYAKPTAIKIPTGKETTTP